MMNKVQRWNPTAAWRLARLTALSVAMLALSGGLASAADYYVATTGNDSNSGLLTSPWLTLRKAQTAVRSAGASDATIHVRGGSYYLTSPLALTYQDSGTTWTGYSNETAIIIGGLVITNWSTYSGGVMVTDPSTQGISASFDQLLFANSRQRMARFPNYSPTHATNSYLYAETASSASSWKYKAGAIPNITSWANPELARVTVWWGAGWNADTLRVSSIDTGTRIISNTDSASATIEDYNRFYIENVFEELDEAGEWYYNGGNRLYFYPSNTITAATVVVPTITNLVTFGAGTSNVMFRNFELVGSVGTAIILNGTSNCIVAANAIHDVGGYLLRNGEYGSGVTITGGYTNGVIGNDISYTGNNGIQLSGGSKSGRVPGRNYADNNYLHHTGVFHKQGFGIRIFDSSGNSIGNRATRNNITQTPSAGIYFVFSRDTFVSSNHLTFTSMETDDVGMIYTWSGTVSTDDSGGSTISHNYCADGMGWGFADAGAALYQWKGNGIYLDGASSGIDVRNNIVVRTSQNSIFCNGGDNNNIQNNIFLDSGYSAFELQAAYQIPENCTFSTNVISYTNTDSSASWLNKAYYNWTVGSGLGNAWDWNVIYNNGTTVYNNGDQTFVAWQETGKDANSTAGDPLLNRATFQLSAGSPALAKGFRQIPYRSIGTFDDPLRASWPIIYAQGGVRRPLPVNNLRIAGSSF